MAALLPLLAGLVLYYLHWRVSRRVRESLVNAAIVWGLLVVMAFEGLSLFRGLTLAGLATFWGVVLVGLVLIAVRVRSSGGESGAHAMAEAPLSWIERVMVGGAVVIGAALLVLALVAPPNTWDAMTYHMPRVMAWVQNRSVEHFPTHASRQLEFPPFAEYLIAQSYILFGSDRLTNLGQWGALVGSAVTASLVAKRLGAGPRGQVLAAVVCVTIPPAILEATGAKNDCVVAFWTLVAVLKLIDVLRAGTEDERGIANETVRFGGAIGLAMFTKGTVYIFVWPVLAVLVVPILWRHRMRALGPMVLAGCLAVAVNTPHFARDYRLIGGIFGSKQSHRSMENKTHAPWVVASNVARNLAAQLATPSEWFNRHVLEVPVVRMHEWAGKDANDPATTCEPRTAFFAVRWGFFNDDNTGGGLHVLLIVAGLAGVAPWLVRKRRHGLAVVLAGALVVSFLTFCLMINWQPWHGRYFVLPLVLWAPVVGVFLETLPRPMGRAVGLVLLGVAVPYVVWNQTRPMIGARNVFNTPRVEQYFAARPASLEPFRRAARVVGNTGQKRIGLLAGADAWAYPLRIVLEERLGRGVRLEYLNGFIWPDSARKVIVPHLEAKAGSVVVVLPSWDWGYKRPAPKVLTEDTGAKFYASADFGEVVVFTTKPRTFENRVYFGRGWYGVERPGWGWANWTSQTGTFVLTRPSAGTVLLSGRMMSTAVPNRVTFRVNGAEVHTLTVDWQYDAPFGPVRLPLAEGDNVIEVTSERAGVKVGQDPRELALLVGNLTVTPENGGPATPLEPVDSRRDP